MYILQALDKAGQAVGLYDKRPSSPSLTLSDIPYVKQFVVRYPGMNAQSVQDFYDNLDATQRVHNTTQSLVHSGNPTAAYKYMNSPEAQENMGNLAGMSSAISKQEHAIQMIYRDPDMPPNDKRQTIDGIYYQMIQIAQSGNKMMNDMRESRKADPAYAQ
jgi:hypothetical protein